MSKTPSTISWLARAGAAVAAATALFAAAPGAGAAGGAGGTGGKEAALQTQAQELAGQIQADGQALDQLAAAYDSAQVRSAALAREVSAVKVQIAAGAAQVAAARTALKEQAILDYITGGGPLITGVPNSPGDDPSLTVAYAEIVAGGQQRAVQTYRSALAAHMSEEGALAADQQQAAATLVRIQTDRGEANQAMAQRQAALGQVKGRIAVLVAQVQAEQQAAVEASLAAKNDLPPAAAPVHPQAPSATLVLHAAPTTIAPVTTTTSAPVQTTPPTSGTDPAPTSPPTTDPPTTTVPPSPPGNQPAPGYQTAINFAYKQLGKPYQWGATGPDSYDCSGLTMMSWAAAAVSIPRVAQDQYDASTRIAIADLQPGDLVFFGTDGSDITHVGLYIGGGDMIDAPETGQKVSVQAIYWSDLVGGGRVRE